MMHFDLSMTVWPFIVSGVIQGLGIGLIFVPLSTLAFATVPPPLRAEGSSVYTLVRNLGASVGISIMQALVVANSQTMHASLAANVIPRSRRGRAAWPADVRPDDRRPGCIAQRRDHPPGLDGRLHRRLQTDADHHPRLHAHAAADAQTQGRGPMGRPCRCRIDPALPLAAPWGALALAPAPTVGPNFQRPAAPATPATPWPAIAAPRRRPWAPTARRRPWWEALGSPDLDRCHPPRPSPTARPSPRPTPRWSGCRPEAAAARGARRRRRTQRRRPARADQYPGLRHHRLPQPDHQPLFRRRRGVLRPRPVRRRPQAGRGGAGPGRAPGAHRRRRLPDPHRQCRPAGGADRRPAGPDRRRQSRRRRRPAAHRHGPRRPGAPAARRIRRSPAAWRCWPRTRPSCRRCSASWTRRAIRWPCWSASRPPTGPRRTSTWRASPCRPSIPSSLPSILVRQRPDILAAEADLHAATAAIGVAVANQYPDIRLSASLTQGALEPGNLFSYSLQRAGTWRAA